MTAPPRQLRIRTSPEVAVIGDPFTVHRDSEASL
jgi:hypothetical protein